MMEPQRVLTNIFDSALHNIGVVVVVLGLAALGTKADAWLGIPGFQSATARVAGWSLVGIGFLLRLWAAFHFYAHRMQVISLEPQSTLITGGPYCFSRNPLYLGGNVFIFFGTAIIMGSPTALVVSALQLPLADRFIRREERQLEDTFGDDWRAYRRRVRRWI